MTGGAKKNMREVACKLRLALENSNWEHCRGGVKDSAWLWAMSLAAERALAARGIDAGPPAFLAVADPGKAGRPAAGCLDCCRAILAAGADARGDIFRAADALGWLHQYWHDGERQVITADSLNDGYSKIDAARLIPRTQVYTEKYMVDFLLQNSLAALWLGARPDSRLAAGWRYYVKRPGESAVKAKTVKDITLIDPACGSGNFLLAAFDMFYSMYMEEDAGQRAAAVCKSIFDNNLFGFDIDDKAVEVARAALWLKAAEKAPELTEADAAGICRNIVAAGSDPVTEAAAELGSLVQPEVRPGPGLLAGLLGRQYDVVVTNPPYLDKRDYSATVRACLRRHYPAGAGNLYAAFILRCLTLAEGYVGMVTPQTFLFITSYKALRREIFRQSSVRVLAHLGLGAFADAVVDTAMFVLEKQSPDSTQACDGVYFKLLDVPRKEKTLLAAIKERREGRRPDSVFELPLRQATGLEGSPVAYWLGGRLLAVMQASKKLRDYADVVLGMKTSDNRRLVRRWWEVDRRPGSGWIPYEKEASGYRFQRSSAHAVRWTASARDFYRNHYSAQLPNPRYWFKPGIVFGLISSKAFSAKLLPPGHMSDMAASCVFPHDERDTYFFLALLNSRVYQWLLKLLNPTVNYQPVDLQRLPVPDSVLAERRNIGGFAAAAAVAAGALRKLDITDRTYSFDEAALLPLRDGLRRTTARIWLEALRYNLARDAIDLRLMDALELPLAERRSIAGEIGAIAATNNLIEGCDQLPEAVDGTLFIRPAACPAYTSAELAAVRARLGQLYRTGLPDRATEFPEEFLELAALELGLHPLTVYQLINQGVEQEGWRCAALEKKLVEDYFSALVLKLLGHRWPDDKPGGEESGGVAAVYPYRGEPTIYQSVCAVLTRYCELEAAERDFAAVVGCSLREWLAKAFFVRHIRQFRRRPVVWQLSSRPRRGLAQVSWLVHHRQARALTGYLATTAGRQEDDSRELRDFVLRLEALADYKADPDFGIRVNIAPFQSSGVLAARVLLPADEKKALADYQSWPERFV